MVLTLLAIYLVSVVYTHNYLRLNKKTYEFIMYRDIKEGDEKTRKSADEFFEGYSGTILIMSHVPIWNIIQVCLIGLVKKNIKRNS